MNYRRWLIIALAATTVLTISGCSWWRSSKPTEGPAVTKKVRKATQRPYSINGKTYYPLDKASGYKEKGLASWYGRPFHGRKTSTGETYNMYDMTAAHKTLPMGTQVRVTHLKTGRSILVRLNDRGPFVHGRIIDLSFGAAKKLGTVKAGVAPVVVEAVGLPAQPGGERPPAQVHIGPLTVQVGAFADRSNALGLAAKLDRLFGPATATVTRFDNGGKIFHRVRAFTCKDMESAQARQKMLKINGFGEGFVVAID